MSGTAAAQCVGESEGLTFWIARPQDYDDVMAISQDIYGGNDYLPYRYHTWMTEPDRVVIIARRSGKLVALESGLIVDGGQTVVVEGLRVCPSERGCGIAGVIQRFTECYIKNVYPNVNTMRLTRRDDPGPEKLSKFTLLARRAIMSLHVESESLKSFLLHLKAKLASAEKLDGSTSNNCKLIVLDDRHELKALFLDGDISSRLQLPGSSIIQDWQPLKLMESNLDILDRRNLTWLADCTNSKPTFMSFHTPPYPVPFNGRSFRFNIDMYGANILLAQKALIAHLEHVSGNVHGMILIHVYMFQTLWNDMMQFCEGEQEVKQYMKYWEQLILEKQM